jgi:hypothetical protein
VPNGDFGTYSSCPDELDQLNRAIGWEPYLGTADFFHGCDESGIVSTPSNLANGFQQPLSDEGYGGIIGISYNNHREIMGIELSEPLVVGVDYHIAFYWSRAFGGTAHSNCNCAMSHLGALLTTQAYNNISDPIEFDNFAHVYDDQLLLDSAGWNLISGWITADQAYTHLAIGNFFDLDQNQIDFIDTNPNEILLKTYYFIENICVSTNPADCGVLSTNRQLVANPIKIYPNPSSGILNVESEEPIISIRIADMRGKLVHLESKSDITNKLDVSDLQPGTYLISIQTRRDVQKRKFINILD